MAHRIFITLMLIAALAVPARGQNSIDRMIEDYSTVGHSKFTSAVERDPKTRKIIKVVKVLELSDADADGFTAAFRRESATGDLTEQRASGGLTLVLTVRGKGQNRVYMMKCQDPYEYGQSGKRYELVKVTVIIKYG